MAIKTKLNYLTYAALVESIKEGFFDEDYNYVPHIGKLQAMAQFYNLCYGRDIALKPHNIKKVEDMIEIADDNEFIEAFNAAIECNGVGFDFANAYKDALEIVDAKKSSIEHAAMVIGNHIQKITESIKELLDNGGVQKLIEGVKDLISAEDLNKIFELSKSIENSNLSSDAVVKR